jgi:hypothetical protein
MKTSVHLLSNDLTSLFNELWDKVEHTVVNNKCKIVTQITLDWYLKPTDIKKSTTCILVVPGSNVG